MKVCTKCKETKDISSFSLKRTSKDGRDSICRSCRSEYSKAYYKKNRESIIKRTRAYRKENPEIQKAAKRRWISKNRDAHLKYRRDWHSRKYESSIEYRLNFVLRGALRRTMDAAKRNNKVVTSTSLPYTPEMLRQRLEMNFKPGMTWDNYGEWHVDHRVPVARLIRRGVKDASQINCLANLEPLWAEDNYRKGKR